MDSPFAILLRKKELQIKRFTLQIYYSETNTPSCEIYSRFKSNNAKSLGD